MFRVATAPERLWLTDFEAIAKAGFKQDEIVELIGIAAFWNLAITISMRVDASLRDE